jgi:mono/diheme cytochrome c family protein
LNYPIWQLGYPGGMLIALIAVLHVFVSHFAIGGGAYLVLTESRAYRTNDEGILDYVKRHSQFFALLTLVFGAVTGVGIWFLIGLVSPEGTSSLIHTYVWAWASEWVFFVVEITAAILYAKTWQVLDRRSHMMLGWIYFVSAWMSLFIINGIITYQLTPGRWLQTHGFWDGFFNPTFWPSLFTRTSMSLLLAGVFGYLTLHKEASATRDRLVRWASGWTLIGAIALPACLAWYFATLPGFSKVYFSGQFTATKHGLRGGIAFACTLILIALISAWKPRTMRIPLMTVATICALGLMGSGEYMREFVRKPWVINGVIYANDIRSDAIAPMQADGAAAHAKFVAVDARATDYGRQLFVLQCSACHSIDGYRSLRKRVSGWDAEFAKEMLAHMDKTRAPMPQFGGNEADRVALGNYLASLNPPENHGAVTDANRMQVGERAFQVHCGSCHTINGNFRPLRGAFQGSDAEQVENLLPMLDSMSPNMPHFAAPEDDTHALAAYITREANKPVVAESPTVEKPVGGGVR